MGKKAALVFGTAVVLGAAGASVPFVLHARSTAHRHHTSTTTTSVVTTTTTVSSSTSSTSTSSTSSTTTTTGMPTTSVTTLSSRPLPTGSNIYLGAKGPVVVALQQRLNALGYWNGPADGTFGATTQQAIYAAEKVAGLPKIGIATATLLQKLNTGFQPIPRRTSGSGVEVSLSQQIAMFVVNGKLLWTVNISSGGGYRYSTGSGTAIAVTPTGSYRTYYQVNKWDIGPLGGLYRPKYFNGGIALHGSYSIPPYPASHGCIRMSIAFTDYLWASNLVPIGTSVWVY